MPFLDSTPLSPLDKETILLDNSPEGVSALNFTAVLRSNSPLAANAIFLYCSIGIQYKHKIIKHNMIAVLLFLAFPFAKCFIPF